MVFNFFGLRKKRASKQEISAVTAYGGPRHEILGSRERPMLLSAVYRCVDLISGTVASMPLQVFRVDDHGHKQMYNLHPAALVLSREPNEVMTRYTFFKCLVTSVLLTGNGFAYIERDRELNVVQLVYIPSHMVGVEWITDSGGVLRRRYRVAGWRDLVEPADMLHFMNFTYDGVWGVSVLAHARQTIDLATSTEEHASGFFKSGASVSGILTVEGPRLSKDQKDQIYKTWEERMDPVTGHPNGVAVLEGNMSYKPISVPPKDCQMLESRLYNVGDVCRFFSVSPVKAYDLSKSSYSTIEATQIQYLTDTVLPWLECLELEINRKVFLPNERMRVEAKFDTSALLKTDKKAQAEYFSKLFSTGAITPNEIRREINLSHMDDADDVYIPVNVQPLGSIPPKH